MALHVVLYQPEIPPNTGNIARTCAVTGTRLHLIEPLGFSLDEKHLKRAGLDYWAHLELEVHASWEAFVSLYGERAIFPATTKAERYYHEIQFPEEAFIVFGRETSGLPEHIHQAYWAHRFKIPMREGVQLRSLNLSNAAAIVIYEALRQMNFKAF